MPLTKDYFDRLDAALATLIDNFPNDTLDAILQEAWDAYAEAGKPNGDNEDGLLVWLEGQEEVNYAPTPSCDIDGVPTGWY